MNDETPKVPIFNPLSKNIVVGWDLQGKNPKTFELVAREITHVPEEFAKHVKRTLADAIFDAKGDYRKEREMQMKDIMDEISPKI